MSDHYAVMGDPIAHSLSPVIHHLFAAQAKITIRYDKILVQPQQFRRQVERFFQDGGKGLNVTLPFKEEAFAMAGVATSRCQQARAANTLWMEQGVLHADNTDGAGFIRDLSRHVDVAGKTLLLLGAGGAARGVIAPLLAASITSLTVTNRTLSRAQDLQHDFPGIFCVALDELDTYDVIIHATSAGTRGESLLWPERLLGVVPFCYDLSYRSNGSTPFVDWVRQHGCRAVDGLGMLVEQAAESFEIWHGFEPETESVLRALRQER
ncbi:shikimate dehydrogenase [Legionella spiritensis]|uniref:Shikimate dehydrogenase (NADP(+)) n=1 Tax=Legionella spiritensis TaxID=452 RepID=A0A0W0Z749_LEGSP|nr:shikimate dehydrogenase [Legionella spiritensis]KTD64750.1 shikimate 5-dehydrogenase [Legionella spiritensis]SNV48194.1 shikimate 5-dehydrogenase [Legionella spiritensis]VEG91430.1 shikimate 5-dehydrogenase [Legionella spiritensis]